MPALPPKPLDEKTARLRAARLEREKAYQTRSSLDDKKIFNLDTVFTFGKYTGKSVEDIIETDSQYINWCLENIKWFELSPEAESYLEAADDPRRPRGEAYE